MASTNKSLTKAEKRVLIAKDVLKLLRAKKFKPKMGNGYLVLKEKVSNKNINSQLKDLLKKTESCKVCALGSLFYAHINRFNEFKVSDIIEVDCFKSYYNTIPNDTIPNGYLPIRAGFNDTDKVLKKYFTYNQLRQIEDDFEITKYDNDEHNFLKLNANDRIIYIMKNIIKNKGTYKPHETNS